MKENKETLKKKKKKKKAILEKRLKTNNEEMEEIRYAEIKFASIL